jgi:hypothetical protein
MTIRRLMTIPTMIVLVEFMPAICVAMADEPLSAGLSAW